MFTTQTRVADIVREQFRTAAVFEKYGIDFCCKGKRPLTDACAEKGLDANEIITELMGLGLSEAPQDRFGTWNSAFLIDYITNNHHAYIRQSREMLLRHAEKVADRHGDLHPENKELAGIVAIVLEDLDRHMQREEDELFPLLRRIEAGDDAYLESARRLIAEMESDHTGAGDLLERARTITRGFTPPANACTTYRVLYAELDAFERDLHRHVHLENNILFPRFLPSEPKAVFDIL